MTPEEKQMLSEALQLSRENNKILKGMRRGQFIANIIHSIKWIVLIVITIWSWLLIQPYFERTMQIYSQMQEATESVNSLKVKADSMVDTSGLQNLLETFRIGTQ